MCTFACVLAAWCVEYEHMCLLACVGDRVGVDQCGYLCVEGHHTKNLLYIRKIPLNNLAVLTILSISISHKLTSCPHAL